jgi:hypothetical protein
VKHAPFLLQAFAARMLASKSQSTVSLTELEQQGYDVQTLCEMIAAYAELPDSERGFLVRATATEIHMQRKPNSAAPFPPKGASSLPASAEKVAKAVAPKPGVKPAAGFNVSSGRTGSQ